MKHLYRSSLHQFVNGFKNCFLLLAFLTLSINTTWGAVIYSTDAKSTPESPASATSATGNFATSAVSWAANYSYYFQTTGSAGYYTLNFSPALSFNGYTDIQLKVYWGSTSNRPLNISVNGGSNTKIDEITASNQRSQVREAVTTLTVASLSSLKLISSGGGAVFIFRIEISGTPSGLPMHNVTIQTNNASYGSAFAAATTVAEGNTTTITATPLSGYMFDYWTVSGTGASLSSTTANPTILTMGTTDATVTAYFKDFECPIEGTYFSLEMLSKVTGNDKSLAANEAINLGRGDTATVINGAAIFSNTGSAKGVITKNSPNQLKFDGNAAFLRLDLDCPLNIGDTIFITRTSGNSIEMCFTTNATYDATYATTTENGKSYLVVPAALSGATTIYGWRATSSTLLLTAINITRYTGTAISETPVIGTQPQGSTYCAGDVVSALSIVATASTGTLSYQWRKDGADIDGANSSTYTPLTSGSYSCAVTNTETNKLPVTVISNAVTVTINGTIATPTFTQTGNRVRFASTTNGATIYYTTDGSNPTSSSASGSSVLIDADCTVKAIAIKDGCESAIGSFNAVYDASAGGECATLVSYTVTGSGEKTVTIAADANNLIGGTGYSKVDNNATDGGYKLGSNGQYVGVRLANGQFLAGDVVTVNITVLPDIGNKYLYLSTAQDGAPVLTITDPVVGDNEFTLESDCNAVYVARVSGNQNPFVKSISVCRALTAYTVTFDKNNASATGTMASQTFYSTFAANLSANSFALIGHDFAGWATAADGSKVYDNQQNVTMTGNLTLYALWTPATYTVTLNVNNGTINAGNVTEYTYGIGATLPSNVTRTGYTFGGWFDNESCTGTAVTEISTTDLGNKVFYALWNPKTTSITLDGNGATNAYTTSVTATFGSAMPSIATLPTLTGKVFGGYYDGAGGTGTQYYTSTGASARNWDKEIASTTLYARWSQLSNVTLHTNGGTINTGNFNTYVEGETKALPTDITQANAEFLGWYDNASFTGSAITEIPTSATGNLEFWAKWQFTPVFTWSYDASISAGGNYPVSVSSTGDANVTLSVVSAVSGVTTSFTSGNPATGTVAVGDNPGATTITYRATSPATATFAELTEEKIVTITKCEKAYNLPFGNNQNDKTHTPRYWDETDGIGFITKGHGTSSYSPGSASWTGENWITSSVSISELMVESYIDNVFKVVVYVRAGGNNRKVSKLYQSDTYFESDDDATDILSTANIVYNNNPSQTTFTSGVDEIVTITLPTPLMANGCLYINLTSGCTVYGAKLYRAEGDLPTSVAFSGELTIEKFVGDDPFTKTATQTTSGIQSSGVITYSSTDETVATVNKNTGEVTPLSEGRTRIIATLNGAGCFAPSDAEYTLIVKPCTDPVCTIAVTTGNAKKCTGDNVTLTATAAAGAIYQWYKDDVAIPGATNSSYTTSDEGIFYAAAKKVCWQYSNTIRVQNLSNPSAEALHSEYYIKAGRVTPDIALFRLENAATFTTNRPAPAGCTYELRDDDILYLVGTPDASLAAATYTLTATAINGCGGANASASMTLHIIAASAKPLIAWIGEGDEGETLPGSIPASQSTSHPLYQYLENYFDLVPVNAYCTIDTNAIREYYSQFDLILLTDYPDTHETPSGLSGDANSYSNAIGCLIDEKPILTFEAFVAGLPNWGIRTKPDTPDPKQKDITLLCTAHNIFDGTVPIDEKIEFLSEIGGNGMQGFTGLQAPNDMIFIATIDDGDGGTLITCCERQAVVEARMMIMGLNYGAMAKVSNDGKRIIKQIIDYLLQTTNVADCALVFDNHAGDHKWSTPGNWAPAHNLVPKAFQAVRIEQDCQVDVTDAHCSSIRLVKGTKGGNTYDAHLTILPNGGLTVTSFIKEVHDNNFMTTYTIAPEDLVIQANATGNGTLVYGDEIQDLPATVQYYSSAYGAGTAHPVWQYMGIPIEDRPTAISQYLYSWMCSWENVGNVSSNWMWVENEDKVVPFKGYCITQAAKTTFTHVGLLNRPSTRSLAMQFFTSPDGDGFNMFANSWVAPLDITKMKTSDFNSAAEPTIYIFNTGSRADYEGAGDPSTTGTYVNPGQYNAIPVAASSYLSGSLTKIPTMQGFFVKASKNGNLTLDYDRLCFNTTGYTTTAERMRAPKHLTDGENEPVEEVPIVPQVMRIDVNSSNWGDRLYILTNSEFSDAFDRGWDGTKQLGDESAPMLALPTPNRNLAVAAIESADDRYLLFRAGKDSTYTFSFEYNGEKIYLYDQLTEQATEIKTGNTYTFTETNTNPLQRFLITTHPKNIPTDITIVESDGLLHFENYDNQLIQVSIVDMQGRVVYSLNSTDEIVDITPSLPLGVYLVHVNAGSDSRVFKLIGKEGAK